MEPPEHRDLDVVAPQTASPRVAAAPAPWCKPPTPRQATVRRSAHHYQMRGSATPLDTLSLYFCRKISADRRNILVQVEPCSMRPDESSFTRSSPSIWAPAGRPRRFRYVPALMIKKFGA
jgi:hypothetical protein